MVYPESRMMERLEQNTIMTEMAMETPIGDAERMKQTIYLIIIPITIMESPKSLNYVNRGF